MLGLLSHGDRSSATAIATWPEEQLQLAQALLFQRDKGAQLSVLANLIVLIWLWWGGPYVRFEQVPRAMRTWIEGERRPAVKHARASARQLVDRIAHPEATGKPKLVETLVDLTYREADPESVRELFNDVFDPDRTGTPRGPAGAGLSTDLYLRAVRAKIEARAMLDTFTQAEYESARDLYRQSRAEYAQLQPLYAKDTAFGHFYEKPNENELANSACADLLTCLAFVRHGSDAARSRAPV